MPNGFHVQIKLFPKDESKLGTGEGSYSSLLTKLFENEKPLLFIPNLGEVKIYLEDWNNPIVRSARSGNWCTSGQLSEKVDNSIREQIDRELKRDFEHCRIPPKYRNLEETAVSFACRRSGRRLVLEANACLYCYLPARDAQWGFRFLMNSDMIPNGSRNDIEYSIDINKYFARIAGEKFFVWLDSLIRSEQYDYDSIFALIPDFEECVKNRAEKVVEFIREFQAGFEAKLLDLQIPSASGVLVPISEVVYDTAGVISRFGVSFWERLGLKGTLAHKSLRECKEFIAFLRRYKDKLGIYEFGFGELLSLCYQMSQSLREWLSKQNNNGNFIAFIVGCGQLESFKDAPIFLNDQGKLDHTKGMFFYDDDARAADKYLGAFHKHIRHLIATTPCLEKFKGEWFAPFDPKMLICDTLFSKENAVESRELLKDITTARKFFAFIVKYRHGYYKNTPYERFKQSFLRDLPAISNNASVADSFYSDKYTIFIRNNNDFSEGINDLPWIQEGWARFLSEDYFNYEEGAIIRQLFVDDNMVRGWNTSGILTGVAIKFQSKIYEEMKSRESDLDFYDFISLCLKKNCEGTDGIRKYFSNLPVLDADGTLVSRLGKVAFYHNHELISWINNGWIRHDAIVILNEKYSSQKQLFDLFNTRTLDDNMFGQVFFEVLSRRLCLDTAEKVVAFHRYMARKQPLFASQSQVKALSNAPKLLFGHEAPKSTSGKVYLPSQSGNIQGMIDSGRLPRDIQVLTPILCDSPEMLEYWKWLGCTELNASEILQEEIVAYIKKQDAFSKSPYNGFIKEHIDFVRRVSTFFEDKGKDDTQYASLFTKLQESVLLLEKGAINFTEPKKLTLGSFYQPFCEYEKFVIPIAYVSDEYGIQAKDFLLLLGVRNDFNFEYVCHFAKFQSFCRYIWTELLPKCHKDEKSLPDKWKKYFNVPCLLNRNGEVKKPLELYSQKVIEALGPVPGCDSHIPDFTRFHDRERDFAQSLGLRTTPYFSDVIEYLLLPDSDKAKAFEWIASYKSLSVEEKDQVQRYRESPNALLKNGQGNLCQIQDLIAISSKSENAKAFSSHPKVLMNRVLGKVENREAALRLLGVKIIADSDLKLEFAPSPKQDDLSSFLLPRLLVYVACREGEEWAATFDKYVSALSQCSFVRCDAIRYGYADMDMWLDRRRFYREASSRKFYYVGDSQGRQVFQCLAESMREWLGIKGDIEELKDVLDSETNLATMIAEKCPHLLENEAFIMTLKDCDPELVNEVLTMAYSEKTEMRVDEQADNSDNNPHEVTTTQQNEVSSVKAETKQLKKDYTDAEEEQMLRIFGNDLTVEQMNDENRLVCIRLFNSLKAQGLEPKMLEADFVRDAFVNHTTRFASTIETNDGRQIHVISARSGVAYLPPKWWSRISGFNNGKYLICAVLSHCEDGFRYLKNKDDLLQAIGDNYVVIRVKGHTAQESFNRTRELFSFNPDLSDSQTYALLRMRSGCPIDAAFEENERLVGMLGDEIVEEDVLDNEDL